MDAEGVTIAAATGGAMQQPFQLIINDFDTFVRLVMLLQGVITQEDAQKLVNAVGQEKQGRETLQAALDAANRGA